MTPHDKAALIARLRAGASTSIDVGSHMRKYQDLCNEAADALAAPPTAGAGVRELREALKPFADYAPSPNQDFLPDDGTVTNGSPIAKRQLTYGDLRRARDAYATLAPEGAEPVEYRMRLNGRFGARWDHTDAQSLTAEQIARFRSEGWTVEPLYAHPPSPPVGELALETWIAREYFGHGVALRLETDPPIPGEPFMSMAIAKDLTRRAVAEFVTSAGDKREGEVVAWLKLRSKEIVEEPDASLKHRVAIVHVQSMTLASAAHAIARGEHRQKPETEGT